MDSGIDVAVIEEDPDLQRLFRDVLADAGFRVALFADHQALSGAWAGGIVLSDSGTVTYERDEIAFRVRVLKEQTGAKVVLVSAHSEVMRDARHFGADAVLRKPFHIDELLSIVRNVAAK